MTKPLEMDDVLASLISLAQAAEARNTTTRGHSERVAHVACAMGRELGLSEAELDRLLLMGRLHNIGTAGVRDSILLKTGELSDEEFGHIKAHTTRGAEMLAPIKALSDVAEVCLNHHERWDGSGYPNGVTGGEVSLAARIIAVADVYSAIISERPHRDSMPRPVAADIIFDERGTRLCPECVDAFRVWFEGTGGRF